MTVGNTKMYCSTIDIYFVLNIVVRTTELCSIYTVKLASITIKSPKRTDKVSTIRTENFYEVMLFEADQ